MQRVVAMHAVDAVNALQRLMPCIVIGPVAYLHPPSD